MEEDTTAPQSGRRVTVDEAARALGLSVDAIRKRVQRGQIAHERDGAGRVRIILDEGETLQDESQDTTGRAQAHALIDAKDETIALLRAQLEAERQAHAEARRLLMAALERIPPQLEAPETPTEATPQPGRVEPQTPLEEAQEAPSTMAMPEAGGGPLPPNQRTPSERPWWRRVFRGS